MKPFSQWNEADVALHNARVDKSNQIPVAESGCEVESELHGQILDECRRRGWIALHGSMASPTRRVEGEPDFLILANRRPADHLSREYFAITYLVECKTRTGKLSPAQQAFHAHAFSLGHFVHTVRSFPEFLNVVDCAVEMAQEGEK